MRAISIIPGQIKHQKDVYYRGNHQSIIFEAKKNKWSKKVLVIIIIIIIIKQFTLICILPNLFGQS
jgi:hypothetical protein